MVAQLWYFVKCIYFGLSAYQIRCGYPTRVLGNFLTKSYNYVNLFLFQGWDPSAHTTALLYKHWKATIQIIHINKLGRAADCTVFVEIIQLELTGLQYNSVKK